MVERVVFFMPPFSQYNVLHHFTKELAAAFERKGVKTRIMEAKYNDPQPFLEELFKEKPDATLSFNGLLPDDKGNFFSDMIKIPHIALLVDSPNRFLPLITSQNTIITCPDRFGCEFFRGINFHKTLFLPHATSKNETHPAEADRPYDVVMLSSFLDYENIQGGWKKQFPPAVVEAMEEAVETSLQDNHTSYVQAFVNALDHQMNKGATVNPGSLNYPLIFEEIEAYLRAKDRIELVKAIKDAKVDIFEQGSEKSGWKQALSGKKNVTFHDAVDFEKAVDIMKKSKIVLNSNPVFKKGAHERVFMGLNLGALVITNDNVYLREQFQDGKSIVFYHFGNWSELNKNIDHYLANEKDRQAVVKQAQKIIAQQHTWDNRAETLIKELPVLLGELAKKG